MRTVAILTFLLFCAGHAFSQTDTDSKQADADKKMTSTSCTFSDGMQVSVRYHAAPLASDGFRHGQPWTPGGSPMFLFTQSDLTLNSSAIPVGAYSMFVIPDDTQWTLTVNKNVKEGSAYDPTQDLVHAPIQIGHLSSKDENVKIVFGHVANKQCNLRIYRGETGAWAEFKEM